MEFADRVALTHGDDRNSKLSVSDLSKASNVVLHLFRSEALQALSGFYSKRHVRMGRRRRRISLTHVHSLGSSLRIPPVDRVDAGRTTVPYQG